MPDQLGGVAPDWLHPLCNAAWCSALTLAVSVSALAAALVLGTPASAEEAHTSCTHSRATNASAKAVVASDFDLCAESETDAAMDDALSLDAQLGYRGAAETHESLTYRWFSSLPQVPTLPDGPLDLAVNRDVKSADDTRLAHGGLSLDYKVSPSTKLGMKMESTEQSNVETAFRQHGNQALAAYFGLNAPAGLSFDAQARWALDSGAIAGRSTETERNEVKAQLKGGWSIGGIKLSPSVAVQQTEEMSSASASAVHSGAVIVAPRISRPIELANDSKLEPFVTFSRTLNVGPLGSFEGGDLLEPAQRSAGVGIILD
ncbi:MAG: hypothetical protein AB7O43_21630, partial [Hyphomicrobiaceae bacterium]